MKTEDLKNLGILGAVLGVAFIVARTFSKVTGSLTTFGEAIGSGLYDYFHPDPVGNVVYYVVRFPNGDKHSVPANTVASDGTFTNKGDGIVYKGDGKRYRLVTDKSGNHAAFLA